MHTKKVSNDYFLGIYLYLHNYKQIKYICGMNIIVLLICVQKKGDFEVSLLVFISVATYF